VTTIQVTPTVFRAKTYETSSVDLNERLFRSKGFCDLTCYPMSFPNQTKKQGHQYSIPHNIQPLQY